MDIRNDTFIETDKQYHSGLCLDDYNDQISVCSAHRDMDSGKVYLDWVFPQNKDRKPIEKSLPWKIDLGDIEKAIGRLRKLADGLYAHGREGEPALAPKELEPTGPANKKDDVPF